MTGDDSRPVPAAPPGGPPDLAGKFRGALIGTAVGDALGARFEGARRVKPSKLERLEQDPGPLRYTDDTHMTLGMAQSLVERRGFDGARMAALFAQNFTDEPWRGYGPGPPRVFRLLKKGTPWDQAGRTLFGGSGSYGNGAAMPGGPGRPARLSGTWTGWRPSPGRPPSSPMPMSSASRERCSRRAP